MMASDMKTLGPNIDHWLDKTGHTDAELASYLQVDPSAVSHWRGGRNYPSFTNICGMAEFFGTDVSTFTAPVKTRKAG